MLARLPLAIGENLLREIAIGLGGHAVRIVLEYRHALDRGLREADGSEADPCTHGRHEAGCATGHEEGASGAEDGSQEAVSVHRLRAGDLVRVPVGQAFPADGLIEQGRTQANEALLTGESVPVDKPQGAEVVAGSTNLGAPVLVRVQRVGGDTRFESIVSMMRSGQRPDGSAVSPVMPFGALKEMSDVDLQALYLYLKSPGPVGAGSH